jgi:hypothetical protein
METINIQNLAGVATIAGIWLAFWQYRKNLHDRQKQVLVSLEGQLNVASGWSSVYNDGYIGSPSEEKKLEFANPFRVIYGIEHFAIKDALIQIGSIDFTLKFHNTLAQFIQSISIIADQERIREQIGLNDIDIALLIHEKLNLENYKPSAERNFSMFLKSFNDQDKKENMAKSISERIYDINLITHYNTIGSQKSGGLKTLHHALLEEIELQKKKFLKQEKLDYFLFSIFSLPVMLSFFALFNFKINTLIQWILLIVVAILFFIFSQINTRKI